MKTGIHINKPPVNILPSDGVVYYFGQVLPPGEAMDFLDLLLHHIEWKHDEVIMFGRHITTRRKVAWYGDLPFEYTYSKTTKKALNWTKELMALKNLAESYCGTTYNSCLLNLYHSGEEGMGWHSDDEKTIEANSSIASFSLGAARKFSLKHRHTQQKVQIVLENGSLVEMKDTTQKNWLHCLPIAKKVTQPRVNLTFRTMEARPEHLA